MEPTFETIPSLVDIFVCIFAETRAHLGRSIKTRRRVETVRVRIDDIYTDEEKQMVNLRPFAQRIGNTHRLSLIEEPILLQEHGRFVGIYAARLSMDAAKACLREHGNLRVGSDRKIVVVAL